MRHQSSSLAAFVVINVISLALGSLSSAKNTGTLRSPFVYGDTGLKYFQTSVYESNDPTCSSTVRERDGYVLDKCIYSTLSKTYLQYSCNETNALKMDFGSDSKCSSPALITTNYPLSACKVDGADASYMSYECTSYLDYSLTGNYFLEVFYEATPNPLKACTASTPIIGFQSYLTGHCYQTIVSNPGAFQSYAYSCTDDGIPALAAYSDSKCGNLKSKFEAVTDCHPDINQQFPFQSNVTVTCFQNPPQPSDISNVWLYQDTYTTPECTGIVKQSKGFVTGRCITDNSAGSKFYRCNSDGTAEYSTYSDTKCAVDEVVTTVTANMCAIDGASGLGQTWKCSANDEVPLDGSYFLEKFYEDGTNSAACSSSAVVAYSAYLSDFCSTISSASNPSLFRSSAYTCSSGYPLLKLFKSETCNDEVPAEFNATVGCHADEFQQFSPNSNITVSCFASVADSDGDDNNGLSDVALGGIIAGSVAGGLIVTAGGLYLINPAIFGGKSVSGGLTENLVQGGEDYRA